MLATLVHGMVDSSLFLPELAATFWVIIALTVMLATRPPEDSESRDSASSPDSD